MPTTTNDQSVWDTIWENEGLETWRRYPGPFGRISWLLQNTAKEGQPGQTPTIVDLGCGVGVLLNEVHEAVGAEPVGVGVDISPKACEQAETTPGVHKAIPGDLMDPDLELPTGDILLCTETLEHLDMEAVERILEHSKGFAKSFFMVPNACLGPEVEPQHMREWSCIEFLNLLRKYHEHCRVEVFHDPESYKQHGHRGYLLGICGYPKVQTMSFTMPVWNEEADVERVLATFRGAADEIVIAVDEKTDDRTEEICLLYADKVFKYKWEDSFCKARNICIDACTCDWVFMSEGHESLHEGIHILLQLDEVASGLKVLEVRRESIDSFWYFPWLFRRLPRIRFESDVHNMLVGYKEKESGKAHQVATWHERPLAKEYERAAQRRGMNKQELLRKVRDPKIRDIRSMYYLGTEYRSEICPTCQGSGRVEDKEKSNGKKVYTMCLDCMVLTVQNRPRSLGVRPLALYQSIYWFEQFIAASRPIPLRYQARLTLSRLYRILGRVGEAQRLLADAVVDDPTRTEHWLMLGEICEERGNVDLAMRYYEYASCGIGRPPLSHTFIEKAVYSYLPAQRLVSAYGQLGMWDEAFKWIRRVPDLFPHWAPKEAFEEVERYKRMIEEKLGITPEEVAQATEGDTEEQTHEQKDSSSSQPVAGP